MLSTDEKHPPTIAVPEASAPVSSPGATAEASTPGHSLRNEIRVWTRDLLIAIGLALVIIVFLYQPVKVEGTSMAPLLSDQERIFINKFVYRFEPIERGDVVVFWYPLDRSKSFIKRVVGLPGETVEIRQGMVYVNGTSLPEPYVPAAIRGPQRLWSRARAARQLFCDGRSSHQLQRFARVRPRRQPLHLWPRRLCLLARGPFRLACDHGSQNEMTFDGGHTDRSSAPTCHPRAGRRARI